MTEEKVLDISDHILQSQEITPAVWVKGRTYDLKKKLCIHSYTITFVCALQAGNSAISGLDTEDDF